MSFLSDVQHKVLLKKLGRSLDYRLEGEEYDTKNYILVEYRHETMEVCSRCTGINSGMDGTCFKCQGGTMNEYHDWARREWSDDDGWSDFITLEQEPKRQGFLNTMHTDPDLQLEYWTYWEVRQ